jgi:hypothetical protein
MAQESLNRRVEYTWKYTSIQPDCSETVIAQAQKWFLSRSGCKRNAMKHQPPSTATSPPAKCVIVKRIHPHAFVDETGWTILTTHVEHWLTLAYATTLAKLIVKLSKQLCFGCLLEATEASAHNCSPTSGDDIKRYIPLAWQELDENSVIQQWRDYLETDVSVRDVQTFVLLKYECVDYRNSTFKTPAWHLVIENTIANIVRLEYRFTT